MSRFEFLPSQGLSFEAPPRHVYSTDGALFNVLPTMRSHHGVSVVYSDVQKTDCYRWSHNVQDNFGGVGGRYGRGEGCRTWIGAVGEKTVHQSVLEAVPDGVDAFVGRVRLSRVSGPASTWMGRTIPVLPKLDKWLPWQGSCEVEKEIGLARTLHCVVDGAGNLVLEDRQSVGGVTNGSNAGAFGNAPSISNPFGGGGGEILTGTGQPCLIIAARDSKSRGYDSPGTGTGNSSYGTGSFPSIHRRGNSSQCARDDNTSYTSIYTVDVEGFFCRRT